MIREQKYWLQLNDRFHRWVDMKFNYKRCIICHSIVKAIQKATKKSGYPDSLMIYRSQWNCSKNSKSSQILATIWNILVINYFIVYLFVYVFLTAILTSTQINRFYAHNILYIYTIQNITSVDIYNDDKIIQHYDISNALYFALRSLYILSTKITMLLYRLPQSLV